MKRLNGLNKGRQPSRILAGDKYLLLAGRRHGRYRSKVATQVDEILNFTDTNWESNGTTGMTTDDFECEVIDDVVWVRFHGVISADVADRMLPAVMKLGMESGSRRFLYDIRQASLGEEIIDLYNRPAQVDGLGMKNAARHAMLCAKINEKAHFLETVSMNRGFEFRLFTDEAECLAWLKAL